ncbi:ABC transporter ATP-binding protein/permease [bacterium]|nr:ABC transporter ATP-binding protein/permease [bacterium]
MKQYIRILKFVKPYWKRILLAVICMFILQFCTVGSIGSIVVFMDNILSTGSVSPNTPIPLTLKGELFGHKVAITPLTAEFTVVAWLKLLVVFIVFIYILKGLAQFAQSYLMTYAGLRGTLDLRNKLYRHIQHMSLSFFTRQKSGAIMSRIANDVGEVKTSMTVLFGDVIREPMNIITRVVIAFVLSPKLTIISILIFPLIIYPIIKFGRKMRKLTSITLKRRASVFSVMQESLSSMRIVKAFSMEHYESERFSKENEGVFKTEIKRTRVQAVTSSVTEFVGMLGIAVATWLGGVSVIRGDLTIGCFIGFFVAIGGIPGSIKKLSSVNNTIQSMFAAASRIFNVMDSQSEIVDLPNARTLDTFKNKIEFKNVSFAYDRDVIVLKNISFDINHGEVVAVAGPSGSGKTTIANLIPRLYDPTSGEITIDEMNINEFSLCSLRRQMGIVTQETVLFNDTLRQNISYGHQEEVSQEKIEHAAKAALAHEFIMKMPEGYDAVIGDRGVKLSGGEAQRIAIARAILKNPPILILDEATSALDTESEYLVQKAINNLMANRTTFVIAHRLSTIMNADKIIVVEDGKIIETGTHEELVKEGGLYKKLHDLQFRVNTKK